MFGKRREQAVGSEMNEARLAHIEAMLQLVLKYLGLSDPAGPIDAGTEELMRVAHGQLKSERRSFGVPLNDPGRLPPEPARRHEGVVETWNDKEFNEQTKRWTGGWGMIRYTDDEGDARSIFVHFSHLETGARKLAAGDRVSFELGADDREMVHDRKTGKRVKNTQKGQQRAEHVRYVEPARTATGGPTLEDTAEEGS